MEGVYVMMSRIKNAWFFSSLLSKEETGSVAAIRDGQRVIIDRHQQLNTHVAVPPAIDHAINKEQCSRDILFDPHTPSGHFVEIGSGDGRLVYLLGIRGNFAFDEKLYVESKATFDRKFNYVGIDLEPDPEHSILGGDVCRDDFCDSMRGELKRAAVVYSNNVFEHLRRPWIAARNVYSLLQPGGVGITVVPFSQRYHESPGDYFRYTHEGLRSLFEDAGPIEVLRAGYDILGRRNDWQGTGNARDTVPVDEFGAWRETWFTFFAFRKPV
jgi:SAM-dependent methyltransferase